MKRQKSFYRDAPDPQNTGVVADAVRSCVATRDAPSQRTGSGVDTTVAIRPARLNKFFDAHVHEMTVSPRATNDRLF